jgi:hypothetical protein
MTAPERPHMRRGSFQPVYRGHSRGFATVKLPNGLIIVDCPVGITNGRTWAALPSKPILDRDGRHVEEGGKKKYALVLQWSDRETAARWSETVAALVRQHHPVARRMP